MTTWEKVGNIQGPPGPAGVDGADGPAGPPGPAGGTEILTGTAPPTAVVGSEGDFYLDATAHILYGPKSESSRGLPVYAMAGQSPPTWYAGGYTFGEEFHVNVPGECAALRFNRNSGNGTTSRALNLWTTAGVLFGRVRTAETPGQAGWVEVSLPTPVHLNAGLSVVVAYTAASNDMYGYDSAGRPSETTAFSTVQSHYDPGQDVYPGSVRVGQEFADMRFIPPGEVWPVALKGAP